jgi:hypothetical protein
MCAEDLSFGDTRVWEKTMQSDSEGLRSNSQALSISDIIRAEQWWLRGASCQHPNGPGLKNCMLALSVGYGSQQVWLLYISWSGRSFLAMDGGVSSRALPSLGSSTRLRCTISLKRPVSFQTSNIPSTCFEHALIEHGLSTEERPQVSAA